MLGIKKGPYGARLDFIMWCSFMAVIVNDVMNEWGVTAEISSGREGEHSVGSLHYIGHAVDIAIRNNVTQDRLKKIFEALADRLGDDCDVIPYYDLKDPVYHIEYQPKQPMGRLPA